MTSVIDLPILFTIVGTGLAIVGANIALISWLRSDMKSFESELKADGKSFQDEIRGWKQEIYKEMRDFHGRLCSIEGRQHKERTNP